MNDKIERQKEELDQYEKAAAGERVCSEYCEHCKNSLESKKTIYAYGGDTASHIDNICVLDCKCPDFKRKKRIIQYGMMKGRALYETL